MSTAGGPDVPVGPLPPRARRGLALAALILGILGLLPPAPAASISLPHPKEPERLTISSAIAGKLSRGSRVRFSVVATDPQGWTDLTAIRIEMLLGGLPIQEITYRPNEETLAVGGGGTVQAGSPRILNTSFFQFFGRQVIPVRSVFAIGLTIRGRVLTDVPRTTVFRMTATSQSGASVSVLRRPRFPQSYLSWGTLALAAAVALLLGAAGGTLLMARRHRERAPSIWDVVERRLREQRARPPAPAPVLARPGERVPR
jgi:hypothetical protein